MSRTDPIPKPHATKKLAAIDGKLAKAREKERTIRAKAAAAQAEVRRLDDELESHYSQPDADPEPTKLLGQRAKALAKRDEPWDARIRGQQRQVERLESERAEFARQHVGELIAEVELEARERAESVGECARSLLSALDQYDEVSRRVVGIVSAQPGMNGRVVPSLGDKSQQLRRDVKVLATSEVPVPLPLLVDETDPTVTSPVGAVTDLQPGE